MEDLIESLTRENPAEVKTVLATVTLALAVYQLVLIAIAYRGNAATGRAHRASGDTIATLLVLLAVACLGVYGCRGHGQARRRRRSRGRRGRRRPWRQGPRCAGHPARVTGCAT